MKQAIHILFVIIILAFSGCKKDDVKVQSFNIISESVEKHATSITITLNYTYPSVIKTVDGYISDNSNMDNATNAQGEINGKTIKLKFNDLQANTTYYYYYEYSNGIDNLTKSVIKTIITNDYGLPTVTTNEITDITATSAICGGNVIDDGDLEITARGVCWSTYSNPTINDSHTTDNDGAESFTSSITGLIENTKYYVRAYATNSIGTNYGEQKEFKASAHPGAIGGRFSVSATQIVDFSQGNLQYNASTNKWRFAEHQYDIIGGDNANISSNYAGWIDLFGWGTGNDPTNHATGDNSSYDVFIDWGNNFIINGNNISDRWHTLTKDEWIYVLFNRNTNSGIRYAKAKVNDINGIILLPDNWSSTFVINNANDSDANFDSNNISLSVWINSFEENGAVFLPAAGYRGGTSIGEVGLIGYYWSATCDRRCLAYRVRFLSGEVIANWVSTSDCGLSVRLVCDIE